MDFAIEDIEQANEDKGDEIFDLDEEASNIKGVLDLAGIGVGAVGFALGLVIMVIGVSRGNSTRHWRLSAPQARAPNRWRRWRSPADCLVNALHSRSPDLCTKVNCPRSRNSKPWIRSTVAP